MKRTCMNGLQALAVMVSTCLGGIALLHLYWGFGRRWAGQNVLPQHPDGSLVFKPGWAACVIVALGLLALAWLPLARISWIPFPNPPVTRSLLWGAAVPFALRVVGDFRYVGLFRSIRETSFARMDRIFYTPLCAGFAAAFIRLAW